MSKRKKQKRPRTKFEEAGIEVRPVSWWDMLPELLLIAGLLEHLTTAETVRLLRSLQRRLERAGARKRFGGLASQLGSAIGEITDLTPAQSELRALFSGVNLALLRTFPLPGCDRLRESLEVLPHEDEKSEAADILQIMRIVARVIDKRMGRTTRAKLVCMLLERGCDPSWHRLTPDGLRHILSADDKTACKSPVGSLIRAAWGPYVGMHHRAVTEWQVHFWIRGNEVPCIPMKPPDPTPDEIPQALDELVTRVDRLWLSVVESSPREPTGVFGEVVLGLANRVWRFQHHIREAVETGNGEMAETAYRCQWDSFTTLRWILQQGDPHLAVRFKKHEAEQIKSQIEHMRALRKEIPDAPILELMENELLREIADLGQWDPLVPEARGPWSGKSMKTLAKEIGDESGYAILFARSSGVVHGSWRALKRYHLQRCQNSLHRFHHIPYAGTMKPAGLTPLHGALLNAAQMLRLICEMLGVSIDEANALHERVDEYLSPEVDPRESG